MKSNVICLLLSFKCNPGVGLKAFFDMVHLNPKKLILFGGACSPVTDQIAKAAKHWNLVQVNHFTSFFSIFVNIEKTREIGQNINIFAADLCRHPPHVHGEELPALLQGGPERERVQSAEVVDPEVLQLDQGWHPVPESREIRFGKHEFSGFSRKIGSVRACQSTVTYISVHRNSWGKVWLSFDIFCRYY